ncbi:peptide ABC transporter substrate-binding protein [Acrocarpospora macrocephala]|uniref:Peptide ABC transporter substrate-binding protein n=1 Tax=Acrocarpospora macrocephala TaxID=150177 RepID=A0A5M3WRV5_9ACTN|nr:peptide ABC transporter substrate-binding protein [Acrocarpospora macrocephala]GES12065.1 peptide ABC transporter substrate-binding protein [Acrocarpospora macrocephala]
MTVRQGGSIVIGAEQEPDCTDWIASCAGSIWGTFIMDIPTIPRVFEPKKVNGAWTPVATNVMASEPELTAGPPQKITYRINPDAVWSDGQPITSADFEYTALAIRDGKDVLNRTGYSHIAKVDTPDPKTAVVTFSTPYANWKGLFSDSSGLLPSHLLADKDRSALMKDGYSWSGGPWKIESWTKGASVVLVPNENYWGEKPKLDKVTFQFTADTAAAFQAFKTGQLDALYPTPQLDSIDQILSGLPNADSIVDPESGNLEAVWFNNTKPPFDSVTFRQAVSYALDRKAIVTRLYGALGVTEPAQSAHTPLVGRYGATDFAQYAPDLGKVGTLMQGDGWAKGSDGIWAKAGTRAKFTVSTMTGNKRRELTEQILQEQLRTAGFELTIDNTSAGDLFASKLPKGDFQMGLWTLVDTFPQPSLEASFSSSAIPTAANGYSGLNMSRIDVPGLDQVLDTAASTLEEDKRIEVSRQADKLLADSAALLPLDVIPNILLWNRKIGGPLAIDPARGPFWNLAQWGLVG